MKVLLLDISIMPWLGNNLWQQTVPLHLNGSKCGAYTYEVLGLLNELLHVSTAALLWMQAGQLSNFHVFRQKNLKAFCICTRVNINIIFHTIWVPNKPGFWMPLAAVWVSSSSESLKKVEAGYLSFLLFHLSICSYNCLKRFFVSPILQTQLVFLCIHICFFSYLVKVKACTHCFS